MFTIMYKVTYVFLYLNKNVTKFVPKILKLSFYIITFVQGDFCTLNRCIIHFSFLPKIISPILYKF
jgi:hypothetical protein